jgi:divalent metal cation (Fe/Co/Zn/Cd) transporter
LERALRLEYLTVGWNVIEGVVAVAAALAAGSVALLGFGIDSFVESASGSILIWRLLAERRATDEERIEQVERRARKLVAGSLILLAAYIAWDSISSIAVGERPEPSLVGIVLAAVSLAVMWWLAREKRRVGVALGSRAMTADAFQTDACFWLSLPPRRHRRECGVRLLVGGPARRSGYDGLHRTRSARGLAGRRRLTIAWTESLCANSN